MTRRRWDTLPYALQLALTALGCLAAFIGGFVGVTMLTAALPQSADPE